MKPPNRQLKPATPATGASTGEALNEVREAAAKMELSQLICRVGNHVWDPLSFFIRHEEEFIFWTRECGQCSASRTIKYRLDGYIETSWYTYPPGYRISGNTAQTADGRAALRKIMFERLVD